MSVTIRDVAEYAGVSVASVSLVLNRKECRISEETKQKIFEGARELGYETKREKKHSSDKLIGVIYSSLGDKLTEEYMRGIENYTLIYGYQTFQMSCANQAKRCAAQIELASSVGAAGLIVIPPFDMNTDGNNVLLGDALRRTKVPYLLLDRAIYKVFCDFVTADNKLGANMAVDHLIAFGHQKIGILAGRKEIYNTRKRVEGYKEGLVLNGIPFDERLVYYSECTMEEGRKGIDYLVSLGVTAVVACNGELALGVYEYAKQKEKRVGEDLSLVSFANIREGQWLHPTLTSICQPGEQMGRKAAEVIINRITHKDIGSIKTNYFVPALIQGESVKRK